jgi:hypothetical protein
MASGNFWMLASLAHHAADRVTTSDKPLAGVLSVIACVC